MLLEEPLKLTNSEARVLGALVEKEVTTPDYYPLTMNALINACNQRSNREPVTNLDEDDVRQALHGLEDLRLAGRARSADGRVTKYEHWLGEAFNFNRTRLRYCACCCSAARKHPESCAVVPSAWIAFRKKISDRAEWSAEVDRARTFAGDRIACQPGTKESRYAHLLSGPVDSTLLAASHTSFDWSTSPDEDLASQSSNPRSRSLEDESLR